MEDCNRWGPTGMGAMFMLFIIDINNLNVNVSLWVRIKLVVS